MTSLTLCSYVFALTFLCVLGVINSLCDVDPVHCTCTCYLDGILHLETSVFAFFSPIFASSSGMVDVRMQCFSRSFLGYSSAHFCHFYRCLLDGIGCRMSRTNDMWPLVSFSTAGTYTGKCFGDVGSSSWSQTFCFHGLAFYCSDSYRQHLYLQLRGHMLSSVWSDMASHLSLSPSLDNVAGPSHSRQVQCDSWQVQCDRWCIILQGTLFRQNGLFLSICCLLCIDQFATQLNRKPIWHWQWWQLVGTTFSGLSFHRLLSSQGFSSSFSDVSCCCNF